MAMNTILLLHRESSILTAIRRQPPTCASSRIVDSWRRSLVSTGTALTSSIVDSYCHPTMTTGALYLQLPGPPASKQQSLEHPHFPGLRRYELHSLHQTYCRPQHLLFPVILQLLSPGLITSLRGYRTNSHIPEQALSDERCSDDID